MPFAAFDLHKKMVEAILLSDSGSVELRLRFPTTRAELLKFGKKHLTKNHILAVEATYYWHPLELVCCQLDRKYSELFDSTHQ